jgi:hypothetical protein
MVAVLLGVFLLVVLVEGKAGAAHGDGGGDPFLDLVRVRVLGVLLRLVLLVHSVGSCSDSAELAELLHVLVGCFSSLRQSVTLVASPPWCLLPRK